MKKYLFFFIFLFSCVLVFSQVPQPQMLWMKMIEGNGTLSQCVSPQRDGGFVLDISATPGTDSFCSVTTDRTVFLKYNADASILEWSKCYTSNFSDSSFFYIFSTSDSAYILGGTGFGYSHKFLVHKEDGSGSIIWSKSFGDSAETILERMIPTSDGGYILVGRTNYTNVDFPVHYGSWMNDDIAVIKVDSIGNKVWSEVIGGTGNNEPASVVLAPNGGCYIVGGTTSVDYDCTGNHGGSDAYVIRLDSNGNKIWHRDFGGSGNDYANYAVQDGKGGVLIAAVDGSTDGDITHIPSFGCPVWLLDVDSTGSLVWYNCYGGGGGNCWPNSICKAMDGSIWLAGISSIVGAEVDTNYGREDAWFVHADSAGNFLSAVVLGSNQQDEATMVYSLSNGNVIGGGYFFITNGSFSSFLPWTGEGSFLTVFGPWVAAVPSLQQMNDNIRLYPNPANETVTIEQRQQGACKIVIFDVVGRTIYTSTLNGKLQLQVNGWSKGVYFVHLVDGSGYRSVQKLIVE